MVCTMHPEGTKCLGLFDGIEQRFKSASFCVRPKTTFSKPLCCAGGADAAAEWGGGGGQPHGALHQPYQHSCRGSTQKHTNSQGWPLIPFRNQRGTRQKGKASCHSKFPSYDCDYRLCVCVRWRAGGGGGGLSLGIEVCTEAEFLDKIQTKFLRVFLHAIHGHLYSFVLRLLFLQTHETSYSL